MLVAIDRHAVLSSGLLRVQRRIWGIRELDRSASRQLGALPPIGAKWRWRAVTGRERRGRVIENPLCALDVIRAQPSALASATRGADPVGALTEGPSIESFQQRIAALRRQVSESGTDIIAVYAADKIAKVRELRALATHGHTALTDESGQRRVEHYLQSLDMLEDHAAGHPLVRQLRFALEALLALPPESG